MDPVRPTSEQIRHFKELKKQIRQHVKDFQTEPGTAVFYSGWTSDGSAALPNLIVALEFAQRYDMRLDVDTRGVEIYDSIAEMYENNDITQEQMEQAKDAAVREFAKRTSGTVVALVQNSNPGSFWNRAELPELKRNRRVTKIQFLEMNRFGEFREFASPIIKPGYVKTPEPWLAQRQQPKIGIREVVNSPEERGLIGPILRSIFRNKGRGRS